MNKGLISPSDVEVRFFTLEDLDDYCRYFFHSPPGFLEGIGLNPPAPGEEQKFRMAMTKALEKACLAGGKPKSLTILYKGQRIGIHPLSHFKEGESGVMHAHVFHQIARGQGIGTISYVKAIETFLSTFGLREIIFKTPVQNQAPLRIKEKLGLTPVGEEHLESPALLPGGLQAKVYRVDRAELERIKVRLGWRAPA